MLSGIGFLPPLHEIQDENESDDEADDDDDFEEEEEIMDNCKDDEVNLVII